MTFDLVFPSGNEEQLVAMAHKLNCTKLLLCYPLTDPHISNRKEEVAKLSSVLCETVFCILCKDQQEIQKAKKYKAEIVCKGNPSIYEDKRVNYVLGFESGTRKDFIHHRNSGLTQVFINKAHATNKTLLVSIHDLLTANNSGTHLGRIMQNNTFFRKYKPCVVVVSGCSTPLEMRAPKDRAALLTL